MTIRSNSIMVSFGIITPTIGRMQHQGIWQQYHDVNVWYQIDIQPEGNKQSTPGMLLLLDTEEFDGGITAKMIDNP